MWRHQGLELLDTECKIIVCGIFIEIKKEFYKWIIGDYLLGMGTFKNNKISTSLRYTFKWKN